MPTIEEGGDYTDEMSAAVRTRVECVARRASIAGVNMLGNTGSIEAGLVAQDKILRRAAEGLRYKPGRIARFFGWTDPTDEDLEVARALERRCR